MPNFAASGFDEEQADIISGDDGRQGRSGVCSIANLYAVAQNVASPADDRTAQRAAKPLRLGDLCRMLQMDFAERPFQLDFSHLGARQSA